MRHLRRAGVSLGLALCFTLGGRAAIKSAAAQANQVPATLKWAPIALLERGAAVALDRVAYAIEGAESGHGTDPLMWVRTPTGRKDQCRFLQTQPTMSAAEIALTRGKTGPSGAPTSPICTADTATGPMPLPLTTGVRATWIPGSATVVRSTDFRWQSSATASVYCSVPHRACQGSGSSACDPDDRRPTRITAAPRLHAFTRRLCE